jgi:hypothetical protein
MPGPQPEPKPKQHIYAVLIGDWWYHAFNFQGQTLILDRIGRVGQCLSF